MNLARRVAALQARALASLGVGVLLVDLFGTGDSAGDFRDARWDIWLNDVTTATEWMERQGCVVGGLWGLRLGALLAVAAAANAPGRYRRLLLWQPVVEGKSLLTQFLRIRLARSIGDGGSSETTEVLRARLSAGEAVEVAGYELSPELGRAIDSVRMDRLSVARETRIDVLEIGVDSQLKVPTQRIVEDWRKLGVETSVTLAAGEQFWAVQEADPPADLLSTTRRLVEAWRG
jgi:exosortase A-associated hydrolase 2